jgi:SOS-response transcriptional repressor LexA
MAHLTATQKLVNLISRRPSTAAQIVKQCGFASKSSVTSVIASLRANGYDIVNAGENKEGFTRYSLG